MIWCLEFTLKYSRKQNETKCVEVSWGPGSDEISLARCWKLLKLDDVYMQFIKSFFLICIHLEICTKACLKKRIFFKKKRFSISRQTTSITMSLVSPLHMCPHSVHLQNYHHGLCFWLCDSSTSIDFNDPTLLVRLSRNSYRTCHLKSFFLNWGEIRVT